MAQKTLTGTRIRERRIDLGLRQADLALAVGISASYLNLIEHNRRRIAGALLNTLAKELKVDPVALTEGAETGRLDQLRAAAARDRRAGAETARADEFAARFPGWSSLVLAQSAQIAALEGRVKSLTDRLAHDPQLAKSLHEVISAVTSIRSTSSILVGGEDIDADWQRRFHRNIHQDSLRLADASKALVSYLDAPPEDGTALSPQDEVEAYLQAQDFHLPYLEGGAAPQRAPALRSKVASDMLKSYRDIYRADAEAMPLGAFSTAAITLDHDPARLAAQFNVPLAAAMRRLVTLPEDRGHPQWGMAMCDGAGVLTLHRPLAGFDLPKAGGACPLWPLFRAIAQPHQPIQRDVVLPGDDARRLRCYAVATPRPQRDFNAPVLIDALMIVRPVSSGNAPSDKVGTSCRICPRDACAARREPSILADIDA